MKFNCVVPSVDIKKLDGQLFYLKLAVDTDVGIIGEARQALEELAFARSELREIQDIIGNRSVTGVLREAAEAINTLKDVKKALAGCKELNG